MPKVINWFFVVGFLFSLFLFLPQQSIAQETGTTCDLCGYCQGQEKPDRYDQCRSCLYNDNGELKTEGRPYWTVAGCLSTKPDEFVGPILNIVFSISGGLAFLAFIGGSTMILTSSGNAEKLNNGKSIVVSSIFGILLILFSVFLLRFVGVDILRVPEFG